MQLMQFEFDGSVVRSIYGTGGELRFVAADVLDVLGLDRKALERLDGDEKGVSSFHTPGGQQDMTVVNESGLYSLILGSRKPQAKAFKRWVTHEVIPSIHRTGSYSVHGKSDAPASDDKKQIPVHNAWIDQSMRNAQALIKIAQGALGADAHKQMPGMSGPDVAMGLAGLLLRRQRLVMDFDDIHNPKMKWISARVLLVDSHHAGWADDLINRLSREQIKELFAAAARRMS